MIAQRISPSLSPPQTVLGDSGYDRTAVKRATHVLAELAKNEEIVNLIVERGAVPALVKPLVSLSCMQGDRSVLLQLEHEYISLDNVSSMYELSEAFSAISLRHSCILSILEHFDKFIPGGMDTLSSGYYRRFNGTLRKHLPNYTL